MAIMKKNVLKKALRLVKTNFLIPNKSPATKTGKRAIVHTSIPAGENQLKPTSGLITKPL
jgi:hypothetical protein